MERRKFTLSHETRIEIVSNAELREWPVDIIPANLWEKPGYSHIQIPKKLIDMIDIWD